jgi:FkbM family methyltransferase
MEYPMLNEQEVIDGYVWILDRVPSESEIEAQRRDHTGQADFRRSLLESDEFRTQLAMLSTGGSQWAYVETGFGFGIWVNLLDRNVTIGAMSAAGWEPEETRFILSMLEPGDVFWDIGANVGWFSLAAARKLGRFGLVHAFEPHPELAIRIRKSARLNRIKNIFIHSVALGASNGPGTLVLRDGAKNLGSWTLGTEVTDEPRVQVSIRRIDDLKFWRAPTIVKIDVEGAEPLVVRGAERVLSRTKPIVVCEILPRQLLRVSDTSVHEFLERLARLGYVPHLLVRGNLTLLHTAEIDPDSPTPTNVVLLPL